MQTDKTVEVIKAGCVAGSNLFTTSKLRLLVDFFSMLDHPSFYLELMSDLSNDASLKLPSFVKQGAFSFCKGSFSFGYQNNLIFKDCDGSLFLVSQRRMFISEIFFPAEKVVVKFDHSPVKFDVFKIFDELVLNYGFEQGEFIGFYVSQPRPYHYFYDVLPGMYYWLNNFSSDVSLDGMGVVEVSSASFLDASKLFGLSSFGVFETEENLNSYIFERGGFVVKPCLPVGVDRKWQFSLIEDFDPFLIDSVKRSVEHEKIGEGIVLWCGVCNEKRSWREQEEGLNLIVKRLLEIYDDVTLVVDGVTRPVYVDRQSFMESKLAKKDLKEARKIFSRYADDARVSVRYVVGHTAEEKILLSIGSDFFISGFLTDSMYPARFGSVPGVAHGSWMAKHYDHIHNKTLIIKSTKKRDERYIVNNSDNWARQSYSIPGSKILDAFNSILKCGGE